MKEKTTMSLLILTFGLFFIEMTNSQSFIFFSEALAAEVVSSKSSSQSVPDAKGANTDGVLYSEELKFGDAEKTNGTEAAHAQEVCGSCARNSNSCPIEVNCSKIPDQVASWIGGQGASGKIKSTTPTKSTR